MKQAYRRDWLTGRRAAALLAVLLLLPHWALAIGQSPQPGGARADGTPADLEGVGVTEHLGGQIPLDLTFEDERGQEVQLRQYFQGNRPVVLQLGYFGCPMLCGLISQGLVESLRELDLGMGSDFDVIYLSFDPAETSKLGYQKKQSYVEALGRPEQAGGLHMLVGREKNIRQLTDAVGFQYKWVESARQFSHAAVLIVLTPDGRISRYLYGVKFDPKTLRLSLVEASSGKVGSAMDQLLLICFHYDAQTGKYALAAMNLMRLGGILTVAVLGTVLWRLFRRERRSAVAPGDAAGPAGATPVS